MYLLTITDLQNAYRMIWDLLMSEVVIFGINFSFWKLMAIEALLAMAVWFVAGVLDSD